MSMTSMHENQVFCSLEALSLRKTTVPFHCFLLIIANFLKQTFRETNIIWFFNKQIAPNILCSLPLTNQSPYFKCKELKLSRGINLNQQIIGFWHYIYAPGKKFDARSYLHKTKCRQLTFQVDEQRRPTQKSRIKSISCSSYNENVNRMLKVKWLRRRALAFGFEFESFLFGLWCGTDSTKRGTNNFELYGEDSHGIWMLTA